MSFYIEVGWRFMVTVIALAFFASLAVVNRKPGQHFHPPVTGRWSAKDE